MWSPRAGFFSIATYKSQKIGRYSAWLPRAGFFSIVTYKSQKKRQQGEVTEGGHFFSIATYKSQRIGESYSIFVKTEIKVLHNLFLLEGSDAPSSTTPPPLTPLNSILIKKKIYICYIYIFNGLPHSFALGSPGAVCSGAIDFLKELKF